MKLTRISNQRWQLENGIVFGEFMGCAAVWIYPNEVIRSVWKDGKRAFWWRMDKIVNFTSMDVGETIEILE